MAENFEYNPNDYLSLPAVNAGSVGYSVPGGGATYGASTYESYSISTGNAGAGANAATETFVTELGYTNSAGATPNGTVSQIASDLLQLNNRAPSSNNYSTVTSSYQAVSTGSSGLSAVEAAILRSSVPIDINETEEISWNGQRGIWANKAEVINWRGVIPLNEYRINEDPNPEIITKKSQQQLVYQQEVAIRYLRPPTPPPPGEILITQELNTITPPAPPLIIRQQPPRPATPQPLVVREAPPPPPVQVGRKVITISGKRIPPPPRKVVIERLAPLPSKPQSVIIERWLPYSQVKRRVIFQKSSERDPVLVKPRNVIIQWEAPQVTVKKEFKDLGVIRANPAEYVARYGSTLKHASQLPPFVLEIKPPAGVVLAADYTYNQIYELEGDLQALRLIDLDREGLSEYRALVQRLAVTDGTVVGTSNLAGIVSSQYESYSVVSSNVVGGGNTSAQQLISEIFAQIDRDGNGKISVEEAEKLLLRLNSRLSRRYSEDDVKAFFDRLDVNRDGLIDLNEFKRAFEHLL